jgi:acetyl/propionyl-CoA carboxylase alpha subunit
VRKDDVSHFLYKIILCICKLFSLQDGKHELSYPIPKYMLASKGTVGADDAVAPMPGVIEKISVEPGAEVQKGDPLVTMIAMKMEVSRNIHVMFLSVNGD